MEAKVGPLLAYWRNLRRMSQLALATQAEVSPRHVSFIESGRAKPSRDMVLLLASVLDVPLRERNTLLQAAGFAAAYRESELAAPQLATVKRALDAILAQHLPFPAVVLDRRWNIVGANDGADRFFAMLLAGGTADQLGPPNVLRLVFHPAGLRPWITNWEAVAEELIHRVHREAVGQAPDDDVHRLVAEVLAYPGVPATWRRPEHAAPLLPVIPVCFERDGRRFSYFSTVTTLGTPIDVTAQELRIECFYPTDDDTRRAAHHLASGSASRPQGPRSDAT
ncbi:MAG: helix-turn-helix domain-containing protein [Kofleriaceae bacterium]